LSSKEKELEEVILNSTRKGLDFSQSNEINNIRKKIEIQLRHLKSIQDQNELSKGKAINQLNSTSSTPKGMNLGMHKYFDESNNLNLSKTSFNKLNLDMKIQYKDKLSKFNRTPKFKIK